MFLLPITFIIKRISLICDMRLVTREYGMYQIMGLEQYSESNMYITDLPQFLSHPFMRI